MLQHINVIIIFNCADYHHTEIKSFGGVRMGEEINSAKLFLRNRDFREKFEYFLLGLILSVLALSIQTFKPSEAGKFTYLVVIVWTLLLASLIAGIIRIEKIMKAYNHQYNQQLERESNRTEKELGEAINRQEYEKVNLSAMKYYKAEKYLLLFSLFIYALYKVMNIYL